MKILVAKRTADEAILYEFHAHVTQFLDLAVYNLIGKAEFRYTVFKHTAKLAQRLEHCYFVASAGHVAGESQARRTGADHSHLDWIRGTLLDVVCRSWLRDKAVERAVDVGGEALQRAD